MVTRIRNGKYVISATQPFMVHTAIPKSFFMAKPAHKKRKLIQESQSDNNGGSESEREPCPDFRTRQHLLAEEFDLEIALRKRLAATIESRVTWALILQEALSNDITSEFVSLHSLRQCTKVST